MNLPKPKNPFKGMNYSNLDGQGSKNYQEPYAPAPKDPFKSNTGQRPADDVGSEKEALRKSVLKNPFEKEKTEPVQRPIEEWMDPPRTKKRPSGGFVPRSAKKSGKKIPMRPKISKMLVISIAAILFVAGVLSVLIWVSDPHYEYLDIKYILIGVLSSVVALLFVVVILDNIVAYNDKTEKKADERKAIIRRNKIIQPIIDMYLARKNMVITPNERTVRKFQVDADFTVKDMRDMFGPSELISDVGKSKIEIYAYYQALLMEKFTNLVEGVDFAYYEELCDAAMKYITATSYGASAVEAVVGYQNAMAGTKSMRSMVINMIRDEPDNGKFIDAPAAMKNVYVLQHTINDQEKAVAEYLRVMQNILAEEPRDKDPKDIDYE
jgi:hypothetical protein